MAISNIDSIDKKIFQFRKERRGLQRIHRWLVGWDQFSCLDEQVVLAHILSVLDENNLAVSRNEVRNCFNAHYKKEHQGDKKSYLAWLYSEFNIKIGALVSAGRSNRAIKTTKNTSGKLILTTTEVGGVK